ncbi:MAG: Ig-like domain-containing protein, partial [Myxococcales bacterium]|nr:Ig-like domain-containing protein [Myxococcales bacterium]
MATRCTILGALLVWCGTAQADTAPYRFVSDSSGEGVGFMRQEIPAGVTTNTTSTGLATTRTIYLNRLGATLTPGTNNSQANTSSIVSRLSQVPGWNASTADWNATVDCMKSMWSRFDVTITDVDPGNQPHIEAIFARAPSDVGISDYIGGISPFSSNCSVIEHSIVFAFTDNLAKKPRTICEVMSQEIAHSYGLDHQLLAADPMSYLPYRGNREFQDQTASCGETSARPCGISGKTCRANQNSVALLRARVGSADRDNEPPSVGIVSPADSATVPAGFAITASAADNIKVASVSFYIDGELVHTRTTAPYVIESDLKLAAGGHTIAVEATDADGNTATEHRTIVVGDTVASSSEELESLGCSASGKAPSGGLFGLALVG